MFTNLILNFIQDIHENVRNIIYNVGTFKQITLAKRGFNYNQMLLQQYI